MEDVKDTEEVNEKDLNPEEEVSFSLDDVEDDSTELFPGGPTVAEAKEWKKQYGKVYITSIDEDTHVVWRPINRFEYKNHVRNMEQLTAKANLSQAMISMKNEEALADIAVLFPDPSTIGPEGGLAGIPSLISQEIMEASGFVAMALREI